MKRSIASMKFKSYVSKQVKNGFRKIDVARRLEVVPASLYHFMEGRAIPGLRTAYRIEKIVGIRCQDWLRSRDR